MKQAIATAIEELKAAFSPSSVTCIEDGNGGAYVFVERVQIGNRYVPSITWIGGHINAVYPYSDIYPVFIDAGVCRDDGKIFAAPITTGQSFSGRPAIQISRHNNQVQNSPQTAVSKFLKVIDFMKNHQ